MTTETMKNIIIFNAQSGLYSQNIHDSIVESFAKSNIISSKALDVGPNSLRKIEIFLKKENNHIFELSLVTNYMSKTVHLDVKGENTYSLIKELQEKLERHIRRNKD